MSVNNIGYQQASLYVNSREREQRKQEAVPAPTASLAQLGQVSVDNIQLSDPLGLNKETATTIPSVTASTSQAKPSQIGDTAALNKPQGEGGAKAGKKLPPGLAKKSADQLPDGNPWKAALEQRETEAAQKAKEIETLQAKQNKPSVGEPGDVAPSNAGLAQLLGELAKLLNSVVDLTKKTDQPDIGKGVSSDAEAVDASSVANEADANVAQDAEAVSG